MHYYLGVDIGSVSSNFVLMDDYSNIREKVYLRTLGNPVKAIKEGFAQIKSRQGEQLDIQGVGTTGSGRHLADVLLGADVVKNEITTHAVAASALFPGVRTIIEIGGQDSKIIILKNGIVQDFAGHYPRQLSGGMRQRVALLRTYLFASDILLLDEPFAALDAITRHKMQLWLKDIRQRYQPSVLFVTHDINEALLLADRIYVLSARPASIKLEISLPTTPSGTEKQRLEEQILAILEG